MEPEWFDIADQVLDRSSHKYVELVNTRLLAGKKVKHYEDAVVNKLLIKNEIAQKYFDYWLGGIHAVPEEQVPRYENAMSRSGKLARNMAVTYINTRKNKTFCLGQEAIELNRKHAEKTDPGAGTAGTGPGAGAAGAGWDPTDHGTAGLLQGL